MRLKGAAVSAEERAMAANIEIAQMWTLNDDRQSVKLSLPPHTAAWSA